MDYLLESRSDAHPLRIELNRDAVIIGKDFNPTLSPYKKISPIHALFSFHNNSWYVEDLDSEFGVFVNFVKVGNIPKKLKYWDVIGLGSKCFNSDGFVGVLHPVDNDAVNKHSNVRLNFKSEPGLQKTCQNNEKYESVVKGSVYQSLLQGRNDTFPDESVNLQEQKITLEQSCKIKDSNEILLSAIASDANNWTVPLIPCDSKHFNWPSDVRKAMNPKMQKPVSVRSKERISTDQTLSTREQSSIKNISSQDWKLDKYFKSAFPDESNGYQNFNLCSEDINNLSEISKELSCAQSWDAQSSTSSVESMNIVRFPSKSVLLEIERSKTLKEKQLSEEDKYKISKKVQNSNVKSKKVIISKKSQDQKSEQRKNTKIYVSTNAQDQFSMPVKHRTSLVSHQNRHPESKSHKIKQKIYAKAVHNQGTSLGVSAGKNKPGKLKSANEPKKGNFMKSRKQINDSKRKNYFDRDKQKLSKYKIPHKSNRTVNKNESSQAQISEKNLTAANFRGQQSEVPNKKLTTVKKRPENYGSRTKFLLTEMECPKVISKQYNRSVHSVKHVAKLSSEDTKQTASLKHPGVYSIKSSMSKLCPSSSLPSSKKNHLDDLRSKDIPKMGKLKTSHEDAAECIPYLPKNDSSNINAEQFSVDKPDKLLHCHNLVANRMPELPEHVCTNKRTEQLPIDLPCNKDSNFPLSSGNNSQGGNSLRNSAKKVIPSLEETNMGTENKMLPKATAVHKSDKNKLKHSERVFSNVGEDYYFRLIKTIVEMNPKWLYERNLIKDPPPDISKGAISLPICFDSYNAYVSLFFPMLVLEIWEEIFFHSKPILKSEREKSFYFSVISYEYKNSIMILNCESVVNETVSFVPSKNNLVILDLKQVSGRHSASFGFIIYHESKAFDKNCVSRDEWQHLPKEWHTNAKLWSFHVYVKSREMTATNCLMEGNGICNLGDKIEVIDALSSLKFSPLLNDILMPSLNTFSVSYEEDRSISDYIHIQKNVCSAVCNEMCLPSTTAKIMLLQGPPGSGKTNVVACIAEKLARCRDFDMKVLIVAPNNFAVDEIGHQLDILNELSVNPLDFIRFGHSKSPKLLNYSVEKSLEKRRRKYEAVYNLWQSDLNKVQLEMDSFCRKPGIEKYDAKLKKLKEKYEMILKYSIKKWDHTVEKRQTEKVLIDSKVILTTLSDCFQLFKMKELLKFSCCIIDEINQATELDVLFPFALGINKFLLVGDPKQLPPDVKSEVALRCGYKRSILERFQLYFKTTYDNNPAIILTKQFRMQSEISTFPLQYFYSENPSLCSYANGRSKDFPFRPYTVFHDKSELYTTDLSEFELMGTKSILTLCSYFIQNHSSPSIAIIVPSKVERELYLSEIVKTVPDFTVEVETLEHFQGREKSIIIISCFHGFSSDLNNSANFFCQDEKLNVALTRAINTLVICGPLHRFTYHRLWSSLISDAHLRGCYVSYKHEDDLSSLFRTHMLNS